MFCKDDICKHIQKKFEGKAFTAQDFLDFGEYDAIRQVLARLAKEGVIRRNIRGVYDKPTYSKLLRELSAPSPHEVALALARKYSWQISVSGDAALNMLGLSTQIPATWVYVSTGPYKKYQLGKITLEFQHRADSQLSFKSSKTAMVIQALKALGLDACEGETITKLQRVISEKEKIQLAKEATAAPLWMHSIIKKICEE